MNVEQLRILNDEEVVYAMEMAIEHWDWDGEEEKLVDLKGQIKSSDPLSFMRNSDDDGVCVDLQSYKDSFDIYDYISEKLNA